jgi:uncharacterized protein (TIGR03435 family)
MMRALASLLFLLSCPVFGQEFDVVDVKRNTSDQASGIASILPSGQFRAINIPLKEIIKFGFNIRDEAVIGAPGWVETEHFDVVGKAPPVGQEETFWRSTSAVQLMRFTYSWDDTFRLMVQSMLADRFKLAFHRDQRQMNVYALVAAKGGPKIEKAADSSGRPDCMRAVGAELQAVATCKNVTMADFARAMQALAPLYADRTVVDLTGLEGSYDLKLSWFGKLNAVAEARGIGFPEALEKNLGLKLDGRKLPVPVIVIDHVEKPTEN